MVSIYYNESICRLCLSSIRRRCKDSKISAQTFGDALRGTRTAFSRARADQGELIGRNTVGIECGVSVSGKLAWAANTRPIFLVAEQLAQSITADEYAEPPQSVRVPLSAQGTKKTSNSRCSFQNLVRTKGLEPPRLSASDPKSDVATNYTMSAGSCIWITPPSYHLRCKDIYFL